MAEIEDIRVTLRRERLAQGWSIRKTAAMIGGSSSYLAQVESLKRRPSIEYFHRLFDCFPVEIQMRMKDCMTYERWYDFFKSSENLIKE